MRIFGIFGLDVALQAVIIFSSRLTAVQCRSRPRLEGIVVPLQSFGQRAKRRALWPLFWRPIFGRQRHSLRSQRCSWLFAFCALPLFRHCQHSPASYRRSFHSLISRHGLQKLPWRGSSQSRCIVRLRSFVFRLLLTYVAMCPQWLAHRVL